MFEGLFSFVSELTTRTNHKEGKKHWRNVTWRNSPLMQSRKDCILLLAGLSYCIYLLLLQDCCCLSVDCTYYDFSLSGVNEQLVVERVKDLYNLCFFVHNPEVSACTTILNIYSLFMDVNAWGAVHVIIIIFIINNPKLINSQMHTKPHCADGFHSCRQCPCLCTNWTMWLHVCRCHALQRCASVLNQSK